MNKTFSAHYDLIDGTKMSITGIKANSADDAQRQVLEHVQFFVSASYVWKDITIKEEQ